MSGDESPGMYACNSVCVVCLVHVLDAAYAGLHFHHGGAAFATVEVGQSPQIQFAALKK